MSENKILITIGLVFLALFSYLVIKNHIITSDIDLMLNRNNYCKSIDMDYSHNSGVPDVCTSSDGKIVKPTEWNKS